MTRSAGINMRSTQSDLTPWILTLPGILFLAILTHFSCRLEKVANEDFGTEAEVFPLEIFDAVLFQVL